MYRWRPKGNNVIIMPTLGNLLGKKVRFSIENYAWNNSLSANAYIIGQAGTTKEWALFYNNANGRVEFFYGNQGNIQLTATRAAFFGTATGSVDCDLFEFELDAATGNWFCRIDGEIRSSGTITLTGSARVDGMPWRLGARDANDNPADLFSSFFAPANTSFYGDTRVWIDDDLVMHAVIPGGETYVIPDIVRETEGELFLSVTPPPPDGTDFILIFKPEISGGGSFGGLADFTFESGSDSYFGAGGFRVSGQADYDFSSPDQFSYVSQGGLSASGVARYSSSFMYLGSGGFSLSGAASAFKTPIKIDQFLIFGASIEAQSFGALLNGYPTRDDMRAYLLSLGADLPVQNYAVGNATVTNLDNNINGYLNNHPNTENMACIIHIGGNDNTANGVWSSWTEPQQAEFYDRMESICQKVVAAGVELILSPLSYRTNVDPAELNAAVIHPLIKQYSPYWWDYANDRPYVDFYRYSLEAGPAYFRDAVHPTYPYGVEALLHGMFGDIIARAELPDWDGRETYSVNVSTDASRPAGTNAIELVNGSASGLRNSLSEILVGSSVEFSGYETLTRSAAPVSIRQFIAADSYHYEALRSHMITEASGLITVTLGEDYAGRTAELKITGNRVSAPANNQRHSIFASGADSDNLNADASPPEQITLSVTLDEAGSIEIDHEIQAGSTEGYFSAFDLILNEPAEAFEHVGSGGLAIAGQGAVSSVAGYLGASGLSVSGSALISIARGFAYTGEGGVDAGGIAQTSTSSAYAAAGGVSVSGTAPYSFSEVGRYEYTGSGGVLFSGQADLSFNMPYNFEAFGSGGLSVGGSATISSTGAGICIKMGIIVSAAKLGIIIRG